MKLKITKNYQNSAVDLANATTSCWPLRLATFFLLLLFLPINLFANSYADQLIQKAKKEKSYDSRQWKRVLFIPEYWYPSNASLVDDDKYFFSPEGKKNPELEMFASLKAFFSPAVKKERHAQCRFPARFFVLDKLLKFDKSKYTKQKCPGLEKFLNFAQYEAISLVFSNYYVNSPASMFGHTLFRLHRPQGNKQSDLLDDSISFAAFVNVMNPLLYPIQGLTGHFPGKFTMLPYYRKVQEYSNSESRDLWEYELDLTKEEIRLLVLMTSEIGNVNFDYYYLDDNCSFVLLMLLEAVRPDLEFSKEHYVYTIPADTVRSVSTKKDFVRKISYRPSSLAKYMHRYNQLNKFESRVFESIISTKSTSALVASNDCDKYCLNKIADTAIDYIDFDEKLIGEKEPVRYLKLRLSLLKFRAQSKIKSDPLVGITPLSSPPHLGHNSNMLGGFSGKTKKSDKSVFEFQWQPALHDLTASELGYSNEVQIKFLNFIFRHVNDELYLKHLDFIELTSVPKSYPHIKTTAWNINLGYNRMADDCNKIRMCQRFNFSGGRGFSQYFFKNKAMIYSLLNADMLFSDEDNLWFNIAPQLRAGFMYSKESVFKINLDLSKRWPLINNFKDEFYAELTATKFINNINELKLIYRGSLIDEEILLGYRRYF